MGRAYDIHPRETPIPSRPGSVCAVLALVAIVPSAPLLVPELAGPSAVDTEPIRDAVRAAADRLAESATRWIAVGAADQGGPVGAPEAFSRNGDFGAYGVPVPVSLGGADTGALPLPLSMLVAAWVGGQVPDGPSTGQRSVTPLVVDPAASAADCRAIGAGLAAEVAASPEPIGVLVVADGADALSKTAPGGGERQSAVTLQARIDEALAAVDLPALETLDDGECGAEGVRGRVAWQVLAGLCGTERCTSTVLYSGAPFGVGYTVALWSPQS